MKIALVSPYDFAYPGGVTNHISCLERYFTRMGHEVRIVAPASKFASGLGDRFIPIGTPRPIPTSGSIARLTISPWLSSRVKAVLDEEKFDIVHLHEPLMPMLCTTVLRLSQTANIGTFHAWQGKPGYDFAKPVGKWILKRWFRRLDGKIAVSKPARELDYLLKAYYQVQQEIPDSRLIIVGPGTRLRRRYEREVRHSGLRDVVFVGYVDYDELPRYYKTADVFCTPATGWESFGIVLLEAMAVGKPIVASNIDGYARVVAHGVDGLLVPPRNEEMLAQALVCLLSDGALRQQMGARGRLKAEEYSWEHIAQRVLNYYMRVLGEPPGAWRATVEGTLSAV
jgi:phosphatidylinositol alpha-mannosyltransferase